MLPDEIYASSASEESSTSFQYAHPLSHVPVDDGSMRAHLAYDLMTFMGKEDCSYYIDPESGEGYEPQISDDEIDIMIVDGYYREAGLLVAQRLEHNPNNEKALFQKAFLTSLRDEYKRIVEREDVILASDPTNVNALINKGFALANLDCEQEALSFLDEALSHDPDNVMALSNKAYIAKTLWRDEDHSFFLKQAYNASAKHRRAQLKQDEARLLHDMESIFVNIDTPSAFMDFNRHSGYSASALIH